MYVYCGVADNNIGDDGARGLAEGLSSMTGVRDLTLDLRSTCMSVYDMGHGAWGVRYGMVRVMVQHGMAVDGAALMGDSVLDGGRSS